MFVSMKGKGAVIAAAVASLFLAGCTDMNTPTQMPAPVGVKTVHCLGISINRCGGKNGCPTKSIMTNLTAKQCLDQGGTIVQ
jgi:hypothetical protein